MMSPMSLPETTDYALIERSRAGEDQAFEELMRRYLQSVWYFARQYAKLEADTEDIVQDTFFKVWKNLKRFDPSKPFRPWLYTIARNTALDYLKKRRAFSFSDMDPDDSELSFEDTLESTEPTPLDIFEQKANQSILDESLEILHPEHRAVMIMHYQDGLTFEEIAVVVAKPMNTVKSWHRRALSKLKKHLMHQNH